ncbi:membrane protein [Cognatiyoonia koreensis]|uniref:Membrane protein n=1 Tax=Cognatiyoonia koreensis TaxID=364200 RepID=A0A1I0PRU1_9RHOB|nr:YihY/virulence factor BrkB family protein [Cognatiyoonia koreensis]SEW17004.1 membrane protein [Cognatiyoonia koreensis]
MARGRSATSPTDIPSKGWMDIGWRLKDEIAADRVGLTAAGVAFYGLLALFPAITAILAIAGLFIDPQNMISELGMLSQFMPDQVMEIVKGQATEIAGSDEGGLGLMAILGVLFAIYSASKGMGSLIEGMNIAYDEDEKRGFIRLKLTTIGLTIALLFGIVVSFCAIIFVPSILSFLSESRIVELAALGAIWVTLILLTIFGLSLVYRYGPSRDAPEFQWASVGAVVGCTLWIIGSAAFAYYVENFAGYTESFGALGGAVALLMWFWVSAFVILIGAEINAEMEAQTKHDTTVGEDRPMGQRDATKADNLGEAQTS